MMMKMTRPAHCWASTGLLVVLGCGIAFPASAAAPWSQYPDNPFVIRLDLPAPQDSAGSLICADVDNDGRPDYLVTVPGRVAAYANDGRRLWVKEVEVQVGGSSENEGLPGHHGPGVQAGDVDGDRKAEVLFLTRDGRLHAVDGKTGEEKWSAVPPVPAGAERWEHLIIVNLRGQGDRDLLLQATNAEGYRVGRYLAACRIEDLQAGRWQPLWQRDDFLACAHNGARVADLDGDGRDEILGGTIVGPKGDILYRIPLRGHIDSVFVADVRPDLPGLEVVALEEGGGNRVFLYNQRELVWVTDHRAQEPQNAALGEFDASRPGLEVWCRSRYNEHQKPWTFDSRGQLIAEYAMDDVAPADWTVRGVEVIWSCDWTGGEKHLAAAKERHTSGDVCLFDPVTGEFVVRFEEKADRLYVADVAGDAREELIVLNGSELHIYHNPAPSLNPDASRHWSQAYYRRSKMTWNYYSP